MRTPSQMEAILGGMLRRPPVRLHPGIVIALGVVALAVQVFLPAVLPLGGSLDLPLLVLLYLALLRRHVLIGMVIGMALGLTQDGLSHGPIGLFGLTKTVVGYLASAASMYIEVDSAGARGAATVLFYLLHQVLFWTVDSALLGRSTSLDAAETAILAAIHAGMAILLFRMLDQLKRPA